MAISAQEIRQAFHDQIRTLACPHCETNFTDFAVEWCEAWLDGRREAMRDLGREERDGPVKLKCELCGGAALTDVFLTTPKAL